MLSVCGNQRTDGLSGVVRMRYCMLAVELSREFCLGPMYPRSSTPGEFW
jgi:hypothetical protein